MCVQGVGRDEQRLPTFVSRVTKNTACSFVLHQVGYFPSFSSLVEAGLGEGPIYNENKGTAYVCWKWRPLEKAAFSG